MIAILSFKPPKFADSLAWCWCSYSLTLTFQQEAGTFYTRPNSQDLLTELSMGWTISSMVQKECLTTGNRSQFWEIWNLWKGHHQAQRTGRRLKNQVGKWATSIQGVPTGTWMRSQPRTHHVRTPVLALTPLPLPRAVFSGWLPMCWTADATTVTWHNLSASFLLASLQCSENSKLQAS